jgi:hypothetical protein
VLACFETENRFGVNACRFGQFRDGKPKQASSSSNMFACDYHFA